MSRSHIKVLLIENGRITNSFSLTTQIQHITPKLGVDLVLVDEATNLAPHNVTLTRYSDDLHIINNEGGTEISIDGYFLQPCTLAAEITAGKFVTYNGIGDSEAQFVAALSGEKSELVEDLPNLPSDDSADIDFWTIAGVAAITAVTVTGFHWYQNEHDDDALPPPPSAPVSVAATDDIGMMTGVMNSGDATDDNLPFITGQGIPGATVNVIIDGKSTGEVYVDSGGEWQLQLSVPLTDGKHQISAIQSNSNGSSSPSESLIVVIDTVAPEIPVISVGYDNEGGITGELTDGSQTDDVTPTIRGTAPPGVIVTILIDGSSAGSTDADSAGLWSFEFGHNLTEGEHTITVKATDSAGNVSKVSDEFVLIVDSGVPDAVMPQIINAEGDALSQNGAIADLDPTLTGIGTPGSMIAILLDGVEVGQAVVDESGHWTYTTQKLAEGNHSVSIIETNESGNVSTPSEEFKFEIDVTAPVSPDDLIILSGDNTIIEPGSVVTSETLTFLGQGDAGDVVTLSDNGSVLGAAIVQQDGSWIFSLTTPLPEGEHNISVTMQDAAGNTSAPGEAVEIIVTGTGFD